MMEKMNTPHIIYLILKKYHPLFHMVVDCRANQAREIDINIFNLTLETKEKSRRIKKFVTIKKGCRFAFSCFCACCSRSTFYIDIPIESLRKIIENRTMCGFEINLFDINDEIIYIIKRNGGCCGFCCRDQRCDNGKCASCDFLITPKRTILFARLKKTIKAEKK